MLLRGLVAGLCALLVRGLGPVRAHARVLQGLRL